eukprot:103131_1
MSLLKRLLKNCELTYSNDVVSFQQFEQTLKQYEFSELVKRRFTRLIRHSYCGLSDVIVNVGRLYRDKSTQLYIVAKDILNAMIDERKQAIDITFIKLILVYCTICKIFRSKHMILNCTGAGYDDTEKRYKNHAFGDFLCQFPILCMFPKQYTHIENWNNYKKDANDIPTCFKENILPHLSSKNLAFSFPDATANTLNQICNNIGFGICNLISDFTNCYGHDFITIAADLLINLSSFTDELRHENEEPMWWPMVRNAYQPLTNKNKYSLCEWSLFKPLDIQYLPIVPSLFIHLGNQIKDDKWIFEAELLFFDLLFKQNQRNELTDANKAIVEKLNKQRFFHCMK